MGCIVSADLRWNDFLIYESPKIVRFHDRSLGILYYSLVALIISYILGYQILIANQHFLRKDVVGTARMTIQQPTRNGCNPNSKDCKSDFHALTELDYCKEFEGGCVDFVPPGQRKWVDAHGDGCASYTIGGGAERNFCEKYGESYRNFGYTAKQACCGCGGGKGNVSRTSPENRHQCIFADQHTLMPFGMLHGEMLVPTRIDKMSETKDCNPSRKNGFTCSNEYDAQEDKEIRFVADIERYTIMVAHSYKRGSISGNNQITEGSLLECVHDARRPDQRLRQELDRRLGKQSECTGEYVEKPIECITGTCAWLKKDKHTGFLAISGSEHDNQPHLRTSRKHRRRPALALMSDLDGEGAEDSHENDVNPGKLIADGFFAIPSGDIFSIKKILQLCHLDFDTSFNKEGQPLRVAGTVIEIEVIYKNLYPIISSFGYRDVTYAYKVSERPMEEMKTELFAQHQPNYPQERIIENRHGLYLVVKISGEFGYFSITYLLLMLVTASGLIGVAGLMTDKLAMNVLADKDLYRADKYEECHAPKKQQEGFTD